MRCDVGGASGHVTAKPARPKARGFCRSLPLSAVLTVCCANRHSPICAWPAFYKSSIYAMKVWCLTLGDLLLLRWDAACS